MGVGVYRSNFGGAGESINVRGEWPDTDAYKAYIKDRIASVLSEEVNNLTLVENEGVWAWKKSDGPLVGEYGSQQEAFEAAGDAGAHDESLMSEEEFMQGAHDDFEAAMVECIQDAIGELGLPVRDPGLVAHYRGNCKRLPVDDDFLLISDDVIQIGWRSWECDYVVAVVAGSQFVDYLKGESSEGNRELLEAWLEPASEMRAKLAQVVSDAGEYVRLALQLRTFKPYFPTSSWTGQQYAIPEDIEAEMDALKAKIVPVVALLNRNDKTVDSLFSTSRELFLKELTAGMVEESHYNLKIAVPMYYDGTEAKVVLSLDEDETDDDDAPQTSLCWYSLTDPQGMRLEMSASALMTDDVLQAIKDVTPIIDNDGGKFYPVPMNERTQALFRGWQDKAMHISQRKGSSMRICVSAEELANAANSDLTVDFTDGEELVIATQPVAVAKPAP